MASIIRQFTLDAPAGTVWDAVADFGALHTRLVPGFVTATAVDGDVRTVTFGNGMVVRERLVGMDPARRRLAYTNDARRRGASRRVGARRGRRRPAAGSRGSPTCSRTRSRRRSPR